MREPPGSIGLDGTLLHRGTCFVGVFEFEWHQKAFRCVHSSNTHTLVYMLVATAHWSWWFYAHHELWLSAFVSSILNESRLITSWPFWPFASPQHWGIVPVCVSLSAYQNRRLLTTLSFLLITSIWIYYSGIRGLDSCLTLHSVCPRADAFELRCVLLWNLAALKCRNLSCSGLFLMATPRYPSRNHILEFW